MKNIYFIQPSGMLNTSVYLPYSVGCIAAYSFQHSEIKDNYNLCDFIFMKSPIDEVISQISDPFIVGFSCYMWNVEYNLALAKTLKQHWPNCTIIFGGPQIPDDTELLEKYDYIDILIHGEGEFPFYSIITQKLIDDDFSNIANISYRKHSSVVKTPSACPPNLENLPSPYATGLFDGILSNPAYSNIQFDAVIETNRGCPYGCVYCYWARSGSALRSFPIERVKKDIEWIGTHKISYCVCADGNFGIFERDMLIADYVIETKNKYGYPQKFETAAAKNKDDFTFSINQKLENSTLNRGVSVAVQSMSPTVLEIIGRKNMSVNNLSKQLHKYRKHNIATYTDLILGLPGETKESFCRGLFDVMEAGQHTAIAVHRCEVFPNTPIYSQEMQTKYKIKTISSQLCQKHSCIDEDLTFASRSQIIVETSTMSMYDWYTAIRIATCAQSFHCLGLLRFFAIYLRKAKNISYYDFYMNLYNWIEHESTTVKRILERTCETFESFFKGKGNLYFADMRFGNIYWDFDDGLFLCCAAELDAFYEDVNIFLKRYFDNDEIYNDLFNYQKEMICLPNIAAKKIHTIYDWSNYFKHIFDADFKEPEKISTTLSIQKSETNNWIDYSREIIWYGKRNGRTINKVAECIQ